MGESKTVAQGEVLDFEGARRRERAAMGLENAPLPAPEMTMADVRTALEREERLRFSTDTYLIDAVVSLQSTVNALKEQVEALRSANAELTARLDRLTEDDEDVDEVGFGPLMVGSPSPRSIVLQGLPTMDRVPGVLLEIDFATSAVKMPKATAMDDASEVSSLSKRAVEQIQAFEKLRFEGPNGPIMVKRIPDSEQPVRVVPVDEDTYAVLPNGSNVPVPLTYEAIAEWTAAHHGEPMAFEDPKGYRVDL